MQDFEINAFLNARGNIHLAFQLVKISYSSEKVKSDLAAMLN